MKHITPQAQLWAYLNDDESKDFVSQQLRHIKRDAQDALCIALVAYMRYRLHSPFEDPWMEDQFLTIKCFIDNNILNNKNFSI